MTRITGSNDIKDKKALALGRVGVLSNLDAYYKSQMKSAHELKGLMINLTKARRHKASGSIGKHNPYSSGDVREELRATTRLNMKGELSLSFQVEHNDEDVPSLEDEDSDVEMKCLPVQFSLLKVDDTKKPIKKENDELGSIEREGLRKRKTKDSNSTTPAKISSQSSGWINDESTLNQFEREEALLLKSDPINLFDAFPPASLRQSQKHARAALDGYINAANALSKILNQIKESNITDE